MDKNQKSQIIFAVLLVVALIVWGRQLAPSQGQGTVVLDEKSGQDISDVLPRLSSVNQSQDDVKSSHKDWGRNPFILGASSTEADMALQGIMWDPAKPQALINNQVVGLGDQIGKMRVVTIESQRVILSDGVKTVELKVGP